jgi:hypothetical protein
MTGRIDILNALFSQLTTSSEFKTSGQRMRFWADVPNVPALFTRYIGDEYLAREIAGLPRPPMIMNVQAWIYTRQPNVKAPTSDVMTQLIDAVAASLEPTGAQAVQNLGLPGIVSHCWIEGRAVYDDGAVQDDGQVVCMIPIRILVEWLAP